MKAPKLPGVPVAGVLHRLGTVCERAAGHVQAPAVVVDDLCTRDRACQNVPSLRPGRASGSSGGAPVWFVAVLAEQVAQAIELAVQSLVLRSYGLNVGASCQLVLQPQLVGKQLLSPVAQRRGAVEVACVERGLLLSLHLGELFCGVDKVSDQLRLRICLRARAGQHAQHPFPNPGMVCAESGQYLGGDALALAEQAEQEVLGADVVVPEGQRLPQRQLQRLLGSRRERDLAPDQALAVADDLLDL